MVMGKSLIMPTTWAALKQPPSDKSEEVPIITQLDEERQCLWEMAKVNLEKVHKWYKRFYGQVPTRIEF
jgi:hypothetical protein